MQCEEGVSGDFWLCPCSLSFGELLVMIPILRSSFIGVCCVVLSVLCNLTCSLISS